MNNLRQFEIEVIGNLASSLITRDGFKGLLQEMEFVNYEYTGCGYFLTLRHRSLPKSRSVFNTPTLIGSADGIECGFVVFVENNELTLECHSWGDANIPEDFRNKDVCVRAT